MQVGYLVAETTRLFVVLSPRTSGMEPPMDDVDTPDETLAAWGARLLSLVATNCWGCILTHSLSTMIVDHLCWTTKLLVEVVVVTGCCWAPCCQLVVAELLVADWLLLSSLLSADSVELLLLLTDCCWVTCCWLLLKCLLSAVVSELLLLTCCLWAALVDWLSLSYRCQLAVSGLSLSIGVSELPWQLMPLSWMLSTDITEAGCCQLVLLKLAVVNWFCWTWLLSTDAAEAGCCQLMLLSLVVVNWCWWGWLLSTDAVETGCCQLMLLKLAVVNWLSMSCRCRLLSQMLKYFQFFSTNSSLMFSLMLSSISCCATLVVELYELDDFVG